MLLRRISKKTIPDNLAQLFPFNLKLIQTLESLEFPTPVTFFIGENGSGKSTLLEAIAVASRLPVVGADSSDQDVTLGDARQLGNSLKLEWELQNHRGFFLRAEDFFGFVKKVGKLRKELEMDRDHFAQELTGYGRTLATGSLQSQIAGLEKKYGSNLDANSHGESFLKLFQSRIVPNGLYLLDEPETPLSPQRQLAFMSLMKEMIAQGCQFIIVTHAPIIMAFPDATIYSFDKLPPQQVSYADLEHVNLMKQFLNNPDRYLQHL